MMELGPFIQHLSKILDLEDEQRVTYRKLVQVMLAKWCSENNMTHYEYEAKEYVLLKALGLHNTGMTYAYHVSARSRKEQEWVQGLFVEGENGG